MTPIGDEVERMVHAFSDEGRRKAVRDLANRVRALEAGHQQRAILIEFHSGAFDRMKARADHLERSMREILAFLSTGAFEKAWKLADYEARAMPQPSEETKK